MQKALIAMSGGVDSSVAAFLTQQKGYECIGCTMKLFENEDVGMTWERSCCSLKDAEDARSVAYALGIRHYVFNFSRDFREKIIDKFVWCYENGMTPNPCIDCNRHMKFSKLFDRASILGCDYIVTGHYARIERTKDGFVLKKAIDESKDQSYVLYSMTQEQLAHTLFPLGALTKTQTREIAAELHFSNSAKPDSQDICFVPEGNYTAVVELHSCKTTLPGDFIDRKGKVLGRHKGLIHYTIGQRKGLGLSAPTPLYVCKIDPIHNTVMLGLNEDLYQTTLTAADFNWISGKVPTAPLSCKAKIRYRQPEQQATATANGDGTVAVVFDTPQRAITPGQAVVLYDDDTVLGGGVIQMD